MRLVADNVVAAHGQTTALFGISLDIDAGGRTAVLGRNGVGKTSLMNALMGVLPLRSGRVEFNGDDITKVPRWERVKLGLGYIPQERSGFPQMTVRENLAVIMESRKGGKPSDIDEVLDLFPRLKPLLKRPTVYLSGGQRQQLAIARTLLTKPRLLVLDEPTEGIQPNIVADIEQVIIDLTRRGDLSVLLVEQHVGFALRSTSTFYVLQSGRITMTGAGGTAAIESVRQAMAI